MKEVKFYLAKADSTKQVVHVLKDVAIETSTTDFVIMLVREYWQT